ncbi:caspase family protein [Sphingomonas sp. MMS24-JH45]
MTRCCTSTGWTRRWTQVEFKRRAQWRRFLARWVAALVLLLAAPALAAPGANGGKEPRLALVIANSDYASFAKLGATKSDGDRIAAALTATGFKDASGQGVRRCPARPTLAQMTAAVADFRARLKAAGPEAFGVLDLSGHGAALGSYGDVMLLPVDTGRT